jgi:hypothetical protein
MSQPRSASAIALFERKWWKSDGCLIPTACAISLVVVARYPCFAKRLEASWRMRSRVSVADKDRSPAT